MSKRIYTTALTIAAATGLAAFANQKVSADDNNQANLSQQVNDANQQVTAKKAELDAANQALQAAGVAYNQAKADVETATKNVQQQQQASNDAETALKTAQSNYDAAQQKVDQLTADLDKVKQAADFYTDAEKQQINDSNATYTRLAEKTESLRNNIYAVQPQQKADGTFVPGQLTDEAMQNAIDWLNYYRTMFGLSTVTSDANLANEDQTTAAVEGAIYAMTHTLKDDETKPANVSNSDWDKAANGAGNSNLYQTGGYAYALQYTMRGWLLDDSNAMAGFRPAMVGHRQTMLNPSSTAVGFGTASGMTALQMNHDASMQMSKDSKTIISFPAANLFPASLANGSDVCWSVDFGYGLGYKISNKQEELAVTIQNTTTGQTLNVDNDKIYDTSWYSRNGYSSVAFNFDKKKIDVKANNAYKVTVKTSKGDYSYNFKLYDDSKQLPTADDIQKAEQNIDAAKADQSAKNVQLNTAIANSLSEKENLKVANGELARKQTVLNDTDTKAKQAMQAQSAAQNAYNAAIKDRDQKSDAEAKANASANNQNNGNQSGSNAGQDNHADMTFDNGTTVHFNDSGYLYDASVNGYRWFENGKLYTGFQYYAGTYYWFENGERQDNSFHEAWGKTYYTGADGRAVQGIQNIHGQELDFGNDGTFYLRSSGYLWDGSAENGGYRWYENGELFTGFRYYAGTFYWFIDGVRQNAGWRQAWGYTYYTDQDGRAVQGSRFIDGQLYNFGDDNTFFERPLTGYLWDGSAANGGYRWYENGELFTGFRFYTGTFYWFIDGVRQNAGWREAWGYKYYTDNDGRAVQGWQNIDGQNYYFGDDNTYYLR
ncbi:Glucan-binding domain (YG repeat) [Fructobacillus fructosus]|uniref:Glucan-binding domain (YG repeat) n=2 Tax=Fructobacillus fructosus TaxID=1631 RepID=A0ABM9MVB8_9LACO|nr:Glucan-binding domain (YG repeat) [Fructobacillus fructosus]